MLALKCQKDTESCPKFDSVKQIMRNDYVLVYYYQKCPHQISSLFRGIFILTWLEVKFDLPQTSLTSFCRRRVVMFRLGKCGRLLTIRDDCLCSWPLPFTLPHHSFLQDPLLDKPPIPISRHGWVAEYGLHFYGISVLKPFISIKMSKFNLDLDNYFNPQINNVIMER